MITAPPSILRTVSVPRASRVIIAACMVLAFCGVARAQNVSFTPNGNPSVVQIVTTSSGHYALPGIGTGAADIVWNTGGSRLYFKFGDTSVVATANDVPLDPNCWIELAPGQNQNIGVVTGTATAGVTIIGGSGLATGSGCSTAGSAPSGTQDVNLKQIGGTPYALGSALSSASAPVVIASDQAAIAIKQAVAANLNATVVGTGTFAVQATNNITQINTTTALSGAGATGAGSLRTTAAQDTTTIAGSAPGTAGTPSPNVVSIQGVSGGTAVPTSSSPSTRTLVTLNIKTVTTGGTAVVALLAGQRSAGGWIQNPPSATINLCINEIGTATGTTSSGDTTCITPGTTYQLAASGNAASVISSDSSHPFSGIGLQ